MWPLRDHAFKLEPVFRLIISCKPERGIVGESGAGEWNRGGVGCTKYIYYRYERKLLH